MAKVAPAAGQQARIPELDGVRGLAILLVLLDHYGKSLLDPSRSGLEAVLVKVLSMSFAGVDLFFVLSGFLIGGILIRNRKAENYLAAFYIRRVARLCPIYLVTIAAFVALSPGLVASGTEAGRWLATGFGEIPLWSYPIYLQNILMVREGAGGGQWLAATWSLAVEEQFYLFAPLLIWLLPQRHLPRVLIALIVAAPLLRTALVWNGENALAAYVLLPCRWDSLCIGILTAHYVGKPEVVAWLRAHQGELSHRLWLSLAAVAVMSLQGIKAHTFPMLTLGHTYLAVVGAIVIVAALHLELPLVRRFFRNAALRWLGVVSYGIYLLHEPVLGLVAQATTGRLPRYASLDEAVVVAAALAITLLVAAASWRWFERPILELSARAGYRHAAAA